MLWYNHIINAKKVCKEKTPIQLIEKRTEVSSLRPFGKIKIKLGDYLNEHGITRNGLAESIGVKFQTIDHYCKAEIEIYRLDMVLFAKICCSLQCEISDLLEYVPSNNK